MMAMKVFFVKSGRTVEWSDRMDSLLDLADASGVPIESECRQGNCGLCATRLLSGKVTMETTEGLSPEDEKENRILPCVAVPETDVELDA